MAKHFKGSRDTSNKLSKLEQYLQAYSIALSQQKFARIYIDAFAGSGMRVETRPALPLLDGRDAEPQIVLSPGSARIAIDVEPPFHTLVLIEKDPGRFRELERLRSQYPDRKIKVHNGDANDAVSRICAGIRWHERTADLAGMRGVIFLDPYGMEVDWRTVEAIAATHALDCWYFFPLSGLYRNAPHDPAKLDATKEANLDRVLGTTDWRQRWYAHSAAPENLLETEEQAVVRADVDAIEGYVHERLSTVFKGTVLKPLRLCYDSHAPLASLFFAVANPSKAAVRVATDIAGHILSSGNSSQVRLR